MSLEEAREIMRQHVDKGIMCPVCKRKARVWRRKINSSMARTMIAVYLEHGLEFCYLQPIRRRYGSKTSDNREEGKFAYWKLMEEEKIRRPDGGRAGWWRINKAGEQWVLNKTTVPTYARVYNTRCLQLLGDPWSIVDALGTDFNYRDLMEGR